MKQTRLFAVLLASLMVASAVTSCGGDTADNSSVTGAADTTAAAVETEPVEDDIFSARLRSPMSCPKRIGKDAPSGFSMTVTSVPLQSRTAMLSTMQSICAI